MSHLHSVYDSDTHFKIDPVTRQIENKSDKVILMQNDHNSERFTFDIPRYIDGHDMSVCNQVEVHYINLKADRTEKHADVYPVEDLKISSTSADVVTCSWLISQNATMYAGSLNFLIKFKCITDGVVSYMWNTAINCVSVSSGIDNGETVLEEYSDILAEWESQIDTLKTTIDSMDEQIVQVVKNYMAEHPISSGSTATIGVVELLADKWEEVGENHYSQIVTIDGVTPNSQVDPKPNAEQLAVFYNKEMMLVFENEAGVVAAHLIGQRLKNDYTMQVTITEVRV